MATWLSRGNYATGQIARLSAMSAAETLERRINAHTDHPQGVHMANSDKCEVCNRDALKAALRYNKCPLSGQYEYQCSDCRARIKSGELKH